MDAPLRRGKRRLDPAASRAAGDAPGEGEPKAVFVGLNGFGNHTVYPDPGIDLVDRWVPDSELPGFDDHRAGEATRGALARRFPIEEMLRRGFGFVTAAAGDIRLDRPGPDPASPAARGDHADPPAVAAWAWGLSRIVHVLADDPGTPADRIVLFGHSRRGKAALWAAAQDARIAGVFVSGTGAGGARPAWVPVGGDVEDIAASPRPSRTGSPTATRPSPAGGTNSPPTRTRCSR